MSTTSISLHSFRVSGSREDAANYEGRHENQAAWIRVVLAHAPVAYRSALRITRNSADAQDIQQESMLRAISRQDQFVGCDDGSAKELRAWISRIAMNAAIDNVRRRQRQEGKSRSLDEKVAETGAVPADNLTSHDSNPEELFFRRQMQRSLAKVIRQLTPELRQVCLLRDVLQYTTQEVAQRLGISCLAVRLRLFRARRQLRERLKESPQFQGKRFVSQFHFHRAN